MKKIVLILFLLCFSQLVLSQQNRFYANQSLARAGCGVSADNTGYGPSTQFNIGPVCPVGHNGHPFYTQGEWNIYNGYIAVCFYCEPGYSLTSSQYVDVNTGAIVTCSSGQEVVNGSCVSICPSGKTYNSATNQCYTAYSVPPKTMGKPQLCVGNPCNPATGNKYQAETDFDSDVIDLGFTRHYNSGAFDVNGPLGYGWSHQLAPSLEILTGKIFIHQADGRAEWLTLSNGLWQGDADSRLRLTQDNTGYTLTDQLGVVERYNTSGRIQSRTELNGRTTSYNYDSSQRLTSVTGPFGHTLQLTYDGANRISSVTYPDGLSSQYQYDSAGNLSKVIYQDGRFKLYHYENTSFPHALTGITDENGNRYATWGYDAEGRANLSQHADGAEQVSLVYNGDNSTDVTDSLNTARHYTFQNLLNVLKLTGLTQSAGTGTVAATRTQSYGANGNLASRTDFNGNLSCYAYDLSRNLETVRVEGLSPSSRCPASLSAYTPAPNSIERKVSTQWHANYRLPSQIDEAGRRTAFNYDAGGNLLSKTVTDTATQQSRTWAFTYNSLGQMLSADGPRTDVNDTTTYSYYADSTASHKPGDRWKITNALGHTTTFTAYDANGRLLSLTDPNGLVIGFAYDARGRLTQKTVDGNTTAYTYDKAGNLTQTTSAAGVTHTFTYDAAHRLTDITDALGGNIHYTLDAMGNRLQEDIKDAQGNVVKTRRRVYDALNRLAQDIGAYNQTTSYQYDANGNLTQVTDANGHATQHQYDSLDRLIRSTDALAGLTDYHYDGQDRLTQVTDANNHSTVYGYNALGDLTQLDSPNTGITQYSYDSAGNLVQKTDAGNITATYSYDVLNRLLGIDYPDTNADVVNGYDGTAPNLAGQIGRLTTTRRGDIQTVQQFDLRGNLVSSSQKTLSTNSLISDIVYRYNTDNKLTEIQPSAGRSIQNLYDAAGQVRRVQVADVASGATTTRVLADAINHLPFGPVKSLSYGNAANANRSYNQDYRLTQESVGTIFKQRYGYEDAGNLQFSVDDTGTAGQQDFGYDALGRLSSLHNLNPLQNLVYQYDAVGNRVRQDFATYGLSLQYALDSQRLLSVTQAYSPTSSQINHVRTNARGDIDQAQTELKSPTWNFLATPTEYRYDADRRLSQITFGASTLASYRYDAFGRRVNKTRPGKPLQNFGYAPDGQLLVDSTGSPSHYVYLDGQPLARLDGTAANSPIYYFHNNPLGAPLKVSNAAGQVVWAAQLDPYGQAQISNTGITQNLRFPGQYFDAETSLHYNMQRYYEPSLGRYLQSDPIGLAGGVNTYTYVNNNPLRWIDPKGLDSQSPTTYTFPSSPLTLPLPNTNDPRWIGSPANQALANSVTQACKTAYKAVTGMFSSPYIDPKDVAGKTPSQIDKIANDAGLIPKGPNPQSGQGAYIDPETEEQRILCHPNCDDPHAHVNDPSGQRLDINGNVVPPESPDAHLPISK